jgi:hypothetical protein
MPKMPPAFLKKAKGEKDEKGKAPPFPPKKAKKK